MTGHHQRGQLCCRSRVRATCLARVGLCNNLICAPKFASGAFAEVSIFNALFDAVRCGWSTLPGKSMVGGTSEQLPATSRPRKDSGSAICVLSQRTSSRAAESVHSRQGHTISPDQDHRLVCPKFGQRRVTGSSDYLATS